MNILIIGKPFDSLINLIKKSKLLSKIYTTEPIEGLANIEFSDLDDLVYKAKSLQIDIIINLKNDLIESGMAEIFKKNRLTLFSVNKKWLNLEKSRIAAKKLLTYYSINVPETILAPLAFPVVLKTNDDSATEFIYSMDELIEKKSKYLNQQTYMEEYLEGEIFDLLALWDGFNIIFLNDIPNSNEVKDDRLELFKTKLHIMLSDEHADFMGFFTTRLIWSKNDWYVKEFIMGINEKSAINKIKTDFLYILSSAVYQKLNEIDLSLHN